MDIHIDLPVPYEDNYQARMLEANEIAGLLKMKGSGRDGKSRYTYRIANGMSIEKKYSIREMKRRDVEELIEGLLKTVEAVAGHLLSPDGLILSPDLIFTNNGRYYFCYLPVSCEEYRVPLCSAFHQLTEYLVKRLDYHDTSGIFLVYKLHRETMKDSYELKNILEESRKEEKRYRIKKNHEKAASDKEHPTEEEDVAAENKYEGQEEAISPSAVFSLYTEEEGGIREKKKKGRVKNILDRFRAGRWGEWQDLITEIDGHDTGSNL